MQNYVLLSESLNFEKDPTTSIIAATTITDEIVNDNKDNMNGNKQDHVQELKKEIITTTTELDECQKSLTTSSECVLAKNGKTENESNDTSIENTVDISAGENNKKETVQKSSTTTTCDITSLLTTKSADAEDAEKIIAIDEVTIIDTKSISEKENVDDDSNGIQQKFLEKEKEETFVEIDTTTDKNNVEIDLDPEISDEFCQIQDVQENEKDTIPVIQNLKEFLMSPFELSDVKDEITM